MVVEELTQERIRAGKALRRRIRDLLESLSRYRTVLGLEDIRLTTPDDNIVKLLRQPLRTGQGVSGIRFKGNVIDGILIEDAYIYRVA